VSLVVLDRAVLEREERPIATDADILAGMDASAALADEDVAGDDGLAAKFLHAEPLRVTVAAVTRCSLTFFVRHGLKCSLCVDGLDLDNGKLLAMALFTFHALALFLFENDDLFTALVLKNGGRHAGAVEDRGANFEVFAFASREYFVDLDGGAGHGVLVAVYYQDVALRYSELLALGFNGRFHK